MRAATLWVLVVHGTCHSTGRNGGVLPFLAVFPIIHTPYYFYDLLNR